MGMSEFYGTADEGEAIRTIHRAIALGVTFFDTADMYGPFTNERLVGRALAASRDSVVLATKFGNVRGENGERLGIRGDAEYVRQACDASLERLGVDHVDLYVVHWPGGGPTWAWPGMERARELGYARSIGVSNFGEAELDSVAATATVMPVVNQVNFNPFAFRRALLDACQRHGVTLEAYSPLGTGTLLADPAVGAIVARVGRTPAQVLLRWCVQRSVPVLSKSTHRDRIAENGRIFDFELTGEERAQLDALDRTGGTGTP